MTTALFRPRKYELYDIVRYFNEILNKTDEQDARIVDMRFDLMEWLKITVVDSIRKYPPICWERTETVSFLKNL